MAHKPIREIVVVVQLLLLLLLLFAVCLTLVYAQLGLLLASRIISATRYHLVSLSRILTVEVF